MLYPLYEAQQAALAPLRMTAGLTKRTLGWMPKMWTDSPVGRMQSAWAEMTIHTRITHKRPPFRIDEVTVGGEPVAVTEEVVTSTPFAKLLHFSKPAAPEQPRVVIVAALSGHFSTLMRGTVRTMLADHDVYLIEWNNARDVPVSAGRFGLDEYIDHVIRFLEHLGSPSHVVAVCQPGPPVLAATAILAEQGSDAQPLSLTLMASPIDTSVGRNSVNEMANDTPLSYFASVMVMPVPPGHPGSGRRVYPGFLQLSAFMSMNPQRHINQHATLYWSLVRGDQDEVRAIRDFYDEYFAVLDMDADFYLDTVDAVFQRNLLARGELDWHGHRVDPSAIRNTSLLTVEGERDDVCGSGQTYAAHDLLTGLDADRKHHHLQMGVGHYGIFSGSRWEQETYPVVRNFITAST